MLLKSLFSDSLLYESHPLQNGLEGQVQVCSRVFRCWWKSVWTPSNSPRFIQTRLWYALTHLLPWIFSTYPWDWPLGRRKSRECWRPRRSRMRRRGARSLDWRWRRKSAGMSSRRDTCDLWCRHLFSCWDTCYWCSTNRASKLQMSALLLSNRFCYQQDKDPCPEPHAEAHQSRLWCVIHNEIASNCLTGSQTGLRYYCTVLCLPSAPLEKVWDGVNDDESTSASSKKENLLFLYCAFEQLAFFFLRFFVFNSQ